MKTELDGRKIDHKTREVIRIRSVKQILAGESPENIAKVLGYNRGCVYEWLRKYHEGGFEALKTRKISGRPAKLTEARKKQVFDIVTSKNPLQLKFPFALWTCAMVQTLILDKFGVAMSEVSVGRLLRSMGLTPQRPLRRAWQTAEILEKEAGWPAPKELPVLEPGNTSTGITAILRRESSGRMVLVGHEPMLSELIAHFTVGPGKHTILELKKGGAAFLSFPASPKAGEGLLLWLMPPRVVLGLRKK